MNVDELKQLALAATPGPWWIDSHGRAMISESVSHNRKLIFRTDGHMGPAVRHESTGNLSCWRNDNDAGYIAAANPTAILEIIAQRDELLAALKLAEPLVESLVDVSGYKTHKERAALVKIRSAIAKCEAHFVSVNKLPRITEGDARDIVTAWIKHLDDHDETVAIPDFEWNHQEWKRILHALLAKLNKVKP